jgi:hypothetical protein
MSVFAVSKSNAMKSMIPPSPRYLLYCMPGCNCFVHRRGTKKGQNKKDGNDNVAHDAPVYTFIFLS